MPDPDPPSPPPPATDAAPGADAAALLRVLAHDLRNPLAALRNGAQLMRTTRDPDVARQALAIVERQSAQLSDVVEDVADLATLAGGAGELDLRSCDLRDVVADATRLACGAVERRGQTLAVECPPAPLPLHADAPRLVRSVARVVERASAATPPGGRVALTVVREGPHATLQVADGVAAEPGAAGDVFALDRGSAFGGQGRAALPLVARVLQLHGGSVGVTAGAAGTTIALTLPLAADAGPRSAP